MSLLNDVYTKVTNKIISDLERGNLTWLQPWQTGSQELVCRPLRATGQAYRGINVIALWAAAVEYGFNSPIWLTYKQATFLSGQVRKGEKSSQVVYADSFSTTQVDSAGDEFETTIPFLKCYAVFNSEQINGLPNSFYPAPLIHNNDIQRSSILDQFFKSTGAVIYHSGSKAYYSPSRDLIQMPEISTFRNTESYYATLAHETVHWTSHSSRLSREFDSKRFGDAGYAMEELVAEIGAAFLCADLSITPETRKDHAAYIDSWLKILKEDKRAIFTAANHAQKALDYLHVIPTEGG